MANITKRFHVGIQLKSEVSYVLASEGEIKNNAGLLQAYLASAIRTLVTTDQTQILTNKTIDADLNTVTNIENADIKAAAAIDATKIANGSVSNTEFQYLDGVTSAIQTQIDSKASTSSLTSHTGASSGVHGVTGSVVGTTDTQTLTNKTIDADLNTITNIENADIKAAAAIAVNKLAAVTASRAVVSDASGFIVGATTTSTEIGYVSGVTSSIQTQLSGKVTGPVSATDNALARFDLTTGGIIQNSVAILGDTGALSGITQLDVDNIRTDLNTISSTDTNGNINLDPNGTGLVNVTKDLTVAKTQRLTFATDSATTGSAAVLATPGTSSIRVTNASLVSIGTIPAGASGQVLYLENATGASLSILNDTGATTTNRVYTGTGANLTLANQATICLTYDTTTARWMVVGGTGSSAAVASAGSPDTIFIVDADDYTDTSTFVTGDGTIVNGSALPGGTLQGTFTRNTTTPAEGTADWKYTQAAGSLDSYIFSDAKTINPAFRGKDVGVNIIAKYDGSDNDIVFIVRDLTNNNTLTPSDFYVKASTDYKNYQVVFTIPSTCTSISIGIQVKVLNSGKIIEWDMMSLFDRPFVMANVNDTQSLLLSQPANALTDRISHIRYNLSTATYKRNINPNSLFVVEDYPTLSATRVRFLRDCTVNVSFTANITASDNLQIDHWNSSNVIIQYFYSDKRDATAGNLSATFNARVTAGDYMTIEEAQGTGWTNNGDVAEWSVDAVAQNQSIITPVVAEDPVIYTTTAGQSIANGAISIIDFGTKTKDSASLVTTGASWKFTAASDGDYQFNVRIQYASAVFTLGTSIELFIYKNGTSVYKSITPVAVTGTQIITIETNDIISLVKGDYIDFRTDHGEATARSLITTADRNRVSLFKIGKNALVATPVDRVCYIKDIQSGGTTGGTPSAGAFATRALNTLQGDTSFVSLSSNRFKPVPGTYDIDASAPAYNTARHVIRLRNVTAGTTTLVGSSMFTETTSGVTTRSLLEGRFTPNGTDEYEIQHWASSAGAGGEGFGTAQSASGESFVFTSVKLKKIK